MLLGLCAMMGVAAAPAAGEEAARSRATGARVPAAPCAGEGSARPTSPLLDEAAVKARKSPLRVEVGADELARLEQASPGDRRVRVGFTRPIETRIEFGGVRASDLSNAPQSLPIGSIRRMGAGGFLWTAAVESPGAAALRLRLSGFSLPRNAELLLYDDQGGSFGPYTGRGIHGDGQFWTHTIGGSKVVIQLHYRGEDTERALRASRFVVSDIGHLTRTFPTALLGTPEPGGRAGSNHCSFNASCIENAQCATLPPAIENARDAVAMIHFVSGAFLYVCSGGLVADTDPGSAIPFFITANHCVSKGREARSVEAFFQFETPCGGACGLTASVPRTLGSSLLSTNRSSDYTLLQLSEPAPSGSWFLGWDASEVAFSHDAPLHRLSHPAGAPQAYSEHLVDTSKGTCTSWPRGSWIYSKDVFGAVEGGSSGSPVLDADGELVGQLSGACGFAVSDVCDPESNATVDGAFAAYFGEISGFLDSTSSCTDADGDGACAEDGDCDDLDPAIHPAAPESCDDARDNDCDGLVDAADPACQVAGCDLGAPGDSCSLDIDCCSEKCRGKPGQESCR
jgi:hypothetical protein